MGKTTITTELSLSGHQYTKTVTIEDKLRDWKYLERRRQFLEREIPKLEQRLMEQRDGMSDDGILSSITQKYTDMPRGSDVTDRVGNLVANNLEKVALLELRIHDYRGELADVYTQLSDIEFIVFQLKESYQKVLTKHYRDGLTQSQVADSLYFSQQRVEQIIRKCVRSFKRPLWRDEQ